ncbi:MAG: hypothetical protein IGS03_03060 [Candidatus Sericytochromatia bacterium]|nr:hypothetical protein [Candidatus Sericytochromatia bacterium]
MKRNALASLMITSLVASLTLTACGGRAPMGMPDPGMVQDPNNMVPMPGVGGSQPPATGQPYTPPPSMGTPIGIPGTSPTGAPNPQLGAFKVNQGNMLYSWKARGIAVSGGNVYIAAVDNDGLTKNGTILKMDAMSGDKWENLGSRMLGLSSKMSSTLQDVAVAGGNIFAIDSSEGVYTIHGSGQVRHIKGGGGSYLAGNNNGLFIASNGIMERSDMSGEARTPMHNIRVSGGMGADTRGSVYFINGNRIGMLDPNGVPRDVIQQGLMSPLDVAGDGRTGEIYVLEPTEIKRYSNNGQLLASFPHGAAQPSGIAVDETGNVYVCDFSKSSQVFKFGPPGGMNQQPGMNNGMGFGNGFGSVPYNNHPDPYGGGGMNQQPGMGFGGGYGMNNGYNSGFGSGYGMNNGYNSGYGAYNAPQQMVPQQQMMPPQQALPQQTTRNRQY